MTTLLFSGSCTAANDNYTRNKDHNMRLIQAHPTTDMDIDKTAKAFGEWGKSKMTAHTKGGGRARKQWG